MILRRSGMLLLASLASPWAHAGGRIPIAKPTMISAPGHYVVTRDIVGTGPLNAAAIEIVSTDVLLDLDGHTITAGTDTGIFLGPPIQTPGSIEIRNGQVRGVYRGIWQNGGAASRVRLERLDISGSNLDPPVLIEGAPVVEVVDCTVHDASAAAAIRITAGGLPQWTGSLTGNRVRSIPADAFQLDQMRGGIVSDNVVTDYGAPSIWGTQPKAILLTDSVGVRVERNVVQGKASSLSRYGIALTFSSERCLVLDNVVSGDMVAGIATDGNGHLLSGNTVGGSKGMGIRVFGSGNTLTGNTVESGTQYGVYVVGEGNLVDRNTIEGHQGTGLVLGGGMNVIRGNLLHNNLGGTVSGPAIDAGGNIP